MAPKHIKKSVGLDAVADRFTRWVGSPVSILIHTILFLGSFVFVILGTPLDTVLLVLTTAVSLEAIYLALFIQMSVNKNTQSLADVEEDLEEIQEDVEGIEKDIDEIEKDIDEIQEDVEEIEKDDEEDDLHDEATMKTLNQLQKDIMKVMEDLQTLKSQKKE
jgi:septal ring factor EnvC (AmiA/AmiB activator)